MCVCLRERKREKEDVRGVAVDSAVQDLLNKDTQYRKVGVSVCVCENVCVGVSMCVREREREGEGGRTESGCRFCSTGFAQQGHPVQVSV